MNLSNDMTEFVVLATLDYSKFIIWPACEQSPMIYKKVFGPTSEEECKKVVKTYENSNPFIVDKGIYEA